jgi:hypothetical protein
MAEASAIMEKVRSLKSNDSMAMKKNKGTVTGSLIGMATGLLYGLTKNYNLISSAIVGAVVGGVAAYILLPSVEPEEEE